VLGCSLDESSDEKSERVFAVGGFIAPNLLAWSEAERLWQLRLEKDGLAYFRSADCQNVHGPFEKFRANRKSLAPAERQKVDSIRSDLIQVIITCGLMGFSFGLLMADYNELRSSSKDTARVLGDVPYHLAYQLAMTHSGQILNETNLQHEILGFVCDEHEKYASHAKTTYDELRIKNPQVAEYMGSLTYVDDKKSPAVQMADLMSYEAMHKSLRWLDKNPLDRKAFIELMPAIYKIEMGNKPWLEEFVRVNSV
jgi:hypothetical protein